MGHCRAVLAAVLAMMAAWVADARAGTVVFDTGTEVGPAVLTLSYDDADLNDKLRFKRNQLDVSDLFSVSLQVGGRAYDLSAALGGALILDRKAGTLTYIASDAALDAGAPASQITLFFGGRLKVKRFSDLIGVLSSATPEQFEIMLTEAVFYPVPLPGAAWLFAAGAAVLGRLRACQAG